MKEEAAIFKGGCLREMYGPVKRSRHVRLFILHNQNVVVANWAVGPVR